MVDEARPFYRRWVVANGWSEAAGLGTTLVLGQRLAPILGEAPGAWVVLGGAVLAIVLGVVLEGVIVGWAQASVVRSRLASVSVRRWVTATAAGAGLAWAAGMVPSTIMAIQPSVPPSAAAPAAPSVAVQYLLAAALGAITGPILGVAQWTVLRRHVERAARWLGANALAWAVGMPLIFVGMDLAPWAAPRAAIVAWIYAVCGVTGTVVGAIHGRALVRLTAPRAAGSQR